MVTDPLLVLGYRAAMPTEKPVDDKVRPVVIRMPEELHKALKEKAAAEERSMAQTIRHALRLYATS